MTVSANSAATVLPAPAKINEAPALAFRRLNDQFIHPGRHHDVHPHPIRSSHQQEVSPLSSLKVVDLQVANWIGNVIQKIQDLIGWISRIKLPDFSKIPVVGGVMGFIGQIHQQGGEAAYTGFHWLEKGEMVLNKQQQAASGVGITLVQHIHGNLMTERQTLQWAREGIRRLDRSQS
jgi:hypothetical protein